MSKISNRETKSDSKSDSNSKNEINLDLNEDYRDTGIKALATVLKRPENAVIVEKAIYKKLSENKNLDIETYKWCVYGVIGILLENTDKKQVLADIKNGKIGWNSHVYDDISAKLNEFDEYLVIPIQVVDGVVECPRCKSKRTWNIQKQVRSSDEPMTTFSRCVDCGFQWSYSG
jgi:DNA-directed RNA polymerase subunit M/transcription elongation factor TFIIS